jgi:hypothetical protein
MTGHAAPSAGAVWRQTWTGSPSRAASRPRPRSRTAPRRSATRFGGLVLRVHVTDEGRQKAQAPVARGAGGLGGVALARDARAQGDVAELRLLVAPFEPDHDEADPGAIGSPLDRPQAVTVQHPAGGVIAEFGPWPVGAVARFGEGVDEDARPVRQIVEMGRAQAQALGFQHRDAGGVEGGGLGGGAGRRQEAAGGHAGLRWRKTTSSSSWREACSSRVAPRRRATACEAWFSGCA